jgi:hypothetical protein
MKVPSDEHGGRYSDRLLAPQSKGRSVRPFLLRHRLAEEPYFYHKYLMFRELRRDGMQFNSTCRVAIDAEFTGPTWPIFLPATANLKETV